MAAATTTPTPMTTPPAAFVLGCVPVRLLLAFLVATGVPDLVRAPAVVATAAVGIGFLTIHAMGWRKSGPETSGRPIWWDHFRPVHGALHLVVAVLVALGLDRAAAAVLFGDVLVGVAASVQFYSLATGRKN